MINLAHFKAWLVAEGFATANMIWIGPTNQPKAEPHNCYTLWETGRTGLETQDALDNPTFQCLTRGSVGTVAAQMADEFDRFMLSSTNFDLNGRYVLEIRNLSGPVNLGRDNYGGEDSQQRRTEFSANYRVKLQR
jgi:hypothetical protein